MRECIDVTMECSPRICIVYETTKERHVACSKVFLSIVRFNVNIRRSDLELLLCFLDITPCVNGRKFIPVLEEFIIRFFSSFEFSDGSRMQESLCRYMTVSGEF